MTDSQIDESHRLRFSFVVPAFNSEKYISACLDRIQSNMEPDDELVVVDNGSTDRTRAIVSEHSRARVFSAPDARIAGLRNLGARSTTGDVLAFIDSDCLLIDGWRTEAEATLRSPQVHATGSRCKVPDDEGWMARTWYAGGLNGTRPVLYINSGNLVVKRAAFDLVGGFDERLVTDEDYDLGVRLNQRNLKVVENPAISVLHLKNPRTVGEFFRSTIWHSRGSFKIRRGPYLDKATLMTAANLALWLLGVLLLPLAVAGSIPWWTLPGVWMAVPTTAAIYKVVKLGGTRYFLQSLFLQVIYFGARTVALIRDLVNKLDPTGRNS